MDGLSWKTLLKWVIWGYHCFWKHPYVSFFWKISRSKTHFQVALPLDNLFLEPERFRTVEGDLGAGRLGES